MSNVRTTCPNCDVITVEAPAITVRHLSAPVRSEVVFVCPECADVVVHPLNDRMVPVLIGAGCPVDDRVFRALGDHPSAGYEITPAEIERFVADLDRAEWFDELEY